MILGIDASRAVKKEKTGVEWYSYHLLRAMQKFIPTNWQVCLYVPDGSGIMNQESGSWKWKVLKWIGRGWTQGRLSLEMMMRPPDVLFVPSHTIPFLHPEKTITTVHDVVFLKRPELYDPNDLSEQIRGFNFAKQFAKKIIVPSKATRRDVVDAGVEEDRVAVIPHGVEYAGSGNPQFLISNFQQNVKCQMPAPYRAEGSGAGSNVKYILFVGRIERKKNVMNLIHAFRRLQEDVKLVLAGPLGYGGEDILQAIKTFKLKDRVVQLGWVDREQYAHLLHNGLLLILPSFGEGFGLPVLEAMSAGVPVVCSDIPVLREIGGNAAQYVDPHNPKDITRGIELILANEMLRSEMIKRGKEIAREYSWERAARETWNAVLGIKN